MQKSNRIQTAMLIVLAGEKGKTIQELLDQVTSDIGTLKSVSY